MIYVENVVKTFLGCSFVGRKHLNGTKTHVDATLSKTKTFFYTPNIFGAAINDKTWDKHNYIWNNFAVYYHQIQRNIHPNKQEINSKRVQGTNSD